MKLKKILLIVISVIFFVFTASAYDSQLLAEKYLTSNTIKSFTSPGGLYSLFWDVKRWNQTEKAPFHEIRLANKANANITFNVMTTIGSMPGDVQSRNVQTEFLSSIATYKGAKILFSNVIKFDRFSAFRVDSRISQIHLGDERIRFFINLLIVNKGFWHVLSFSAPLGGNIQSITDLWETVFELVDSFKFL